MPKRHFLSFLIYHRNLSCYAICLKKITIYYVIYYETQLISIYT